MEALIFALMVAGIAMRKSAADIPFVLCGKTPPSHQRRMREMDAREAAVQRRQANRDQRAKARQRRRNSPVRRYTRGVWGHAWKQAAARRVIRWEVKDPIKAAAYREKMRARTSGDIRGGFFPWAFNQSRRRAADAGWRAFNAARAGYRTTKTRRESSTSGATDNDAGGGAPSAGATTAAGAATAESPAEEEVWDAEVVEDTPAGNAPDPEAASSPTDSPFRDAYAAMAGTGDEDYAAYYADHYVKIFGHLPPEDRPEPRNGALWRSWCEERDRHQTPALTAVPEPHHTNEGRNPMSTTGEITGLSDTLALTEAWLSETEAAVQRLEATTAALEGADVGQEVTAPFATAMEAFTAAHQAFVQARTGLQGSVNVGEAYQAAPGAGNKQFVTS